MRTLVYVQSREERSQIRPFLSRRFENITMVNSPEELLEKLSDGRGFDFIILDDTFDAMSPSGEAIYSNGPTVPEILQLIHTRYTENSKATILCILREEQEQNTPGLNSFYCDISSEDRKANYIALGAYNFLQKPFSIDTLNKTLEEMLSMAEKPPQWLELLRQARALVASQKFDLAHALLDKLHSMGFEKEHIGFALLRAQVLNSLGGDYLLKANELLQDLDNKFPKSISIKLNHLDNAMKLERYTEAFEVSLGIFEHQKTYANFDKIVELLLQIDNNLLEKNKIKEDADEETVPLHEDLLILHAKKSFETLYKDPPQFSRKLRAKILDQVAVRTRHKDSLTRLVHMFQESIDIAHDTLTSFRIVLAHLLPFANDRYPMIKRAYDMAHFNIHKVDPLDPYAIELCTQILIESGDLDKLGDVLEVSSKAGAKSIEFYTSSAKYFMAMNMLKDASNTLHKAVQIKADDPRVVSLRTLWQSAYEAKAA